MPSLDANEIIASIVIGAIGFVAFAYGRKMGRVPHIAVGILLMVYPYFVANVIASSAIAVVLLAGLWFAVRLGW